MLQYWLLDLAVAEGLAMFIFLLLMRADTASDFIYETGIYAALCFCFISYSMATCFLLRR